MIVNICGLFDLLLQLHLEEEKTKTKQVGKGRKRQSSVKGAKLLQLQTIVGESKS